MLETSETPHGYSPIPSSRWSPRYYFRKSVQSRKFNTSKQWQDSKDTSSWCFSEKNVFRKNSQSTSKAEGLKRTKGGKKRCRIDPVRQEGRLPNECLGHSSLTHTHWKRKKCLFSKGDRCFMRTCFMGHHLCKLSQFHGVGVQVVWISMDYL